MEHLKPHLQTGEKRTKFISQIDDCENDNSYQYHFSFLEFHIELFSIQNCPSHINRMVSLVKQIVRFVE